MGALAMIIMLLWTAACFGNRSEHIAAKSATSSNAEPPTATPELDRVTAFAAIQRASINQQRLVDSTEAKLGVLALAILGYFVAIVAESAANYVWLQHLEVLALAADVAVILLALLGFKTKEPFNLLKFVRFYKRQAPETLESTIETMTRRYFRNETLRSVKDRILLNATAGAGAIIALDLARRYGGIDVLTGAVAWLSACPWRL